MEIRYTINPDCIFTITNSEIIGIATANHQDIINYLSLSAKEKIEVLVDNKKLSLDELESLKRKTAIITEKFFLPFTETVEDYMDYIIKKEILAMKNPIKKKEDSLKIVGLTPVYLQRKIATLSKSEIFQVQLAVALLSNPSILVFDNPFTYLDLHQEKELITLLQRLKDQYKKIIIIIEDDSNKLYKYTNKMLFIKNNQIILSSPTNEAYTRVDFLKRHRFSIPSIIELTYKAKKEKGAKIIYHKDIRDLIKDIYKHV